jgi:hypothetical protein
MHTHLRRQGIWAVIGGAAPPLLALVLVAPAVVVDGGTEMLKRWFPTELK